MFVAAVVVYRLPWVVVRNVLKHIYKAHVPKLNAHRIGTLKPNNLKRTLMKVKLGEEGGARTTC